ncbi:hypothetical protein SAMN05216223_11853 [Actinacidiphila yanglinensis]|uniref:Uncharacterized protein n=1 Tax=Actinacidiphila yanglinensis TaxID=310779 RepID=A0A1H6DPV9_9ACTN|nr:hypothetical protein [Actinacidiphila yanglinensis]SEG87184.1 hypothetical protein SAMN05216223_11853 [Actinacidiphila yanglinensis]
MPLRASRHRTRYTGAACGLAPAVALSPSLPGSGGPAVTKATAAGALSAVTAWVTKGQAPTDLLASTVDRGGTTTAT